MKSIDFGIPGFKRLDRYGNIGCRVSTKLVRLMAKTEQAQKKIVYILKWNNVKVYLSKIGPIFDNLVYSKNIKIFRV